MLKSMSVSLLRDQKDVMPGMTQRGGGLLMLHCKRCTAWGKITLDKGTGDAQEDALHCHVVCKCSIDVLKAH